MDMLDQALDSSSQDKTNESTTSDDTPQIQTDDGTAGDAGEEQVAITSVTSAGATSLIDPTSGVQYQFRAENGQGGAVTYRVVQVAQGAGDSQEGTAQVITTTAFAGQQGVQAVIASPFSNGNSPTGDGQTGEARFTYYPTVAATAGENATAEGATATLATTATGQFYVMMSPQDVITSGQRSIAPRTHQFSPKVDGPRTARDERRRATHNEVERRRRDKINNWIIKLSKIVPDCSQDHTKQGQSKGGILAKACDYIQDLRAAAQRLAEALKENERLTLDAELLRQQCEELKNENALLRAQLQQHGIVIADISTTS